jgi:hypothetical protein
LHVIDGIDTTIIYDALYVVLAFQIMAEMCIRLGIDPRKPGILAEWLQSLLVSIVLTAIGVVIVIVVAKRTNGPWEEWKFFDYSIEELNATLSRSFIEPLAEFFGMAIRLSIGLGWMMYSLTH